MTDAIMEKLCGSTCWDWTAVWDAEKHDFTACFERTVLAWLPCCFLWLGAGFHYYLTTNSSELSILNRPLNIDQRIVTFVLIVLELIYVAITFKTSHHAHLVDHLNPAVKSVTFILALALQIFNLKKGLTSSAMLFIFWLLTAICDFFPFQTELRRLPLDQENERAVMQFVFTMASYPLVLIQLVLHCFSDKPTESATQVGEKTKSNLACPETTSSLPSRLTFCWFWYMSLKGYRTSISIKDLWFMKPSDTARCIRKHFSRTWFRLYKSKQRRSNGEIKIQNIASSLLKLVPVPLISSVIYRVAADSCLFLEPYLLGLLITQMESHEQRWKCFLYASLMFIIGFSKTILFVNFSFTMQMIGLRVSTAVVTAVAHKSLVISNAARLGCQLGEIINFVSVDSKRLVDFSMYFHNLWCAPLTVAVCIYFLWGLLGAASISGLITMVLIVPLNTWIANMNKRLQLQQMQMKDERTKLVSEFLSGVKVIKLYAWEPFFEGQINEIRNKELEILKKSAVLHAFNVFIFAVAPCLVSLCTFGTYVLMDNGNVLDARKVFVSLSYLNLMRKPVQSLPTAIGNFTAACISLQRINKFMNGMEISPNDVLHDLSPNGAAMSVKCGSFGWGCEAILQDINLSVKEGSLLAVVGRVGSGKTSLLAAILGEMAKLSGTVNTWGSIAYVAQQAWIQNATLRDNILFGSPYEANKYEQVLEACALLPDLKILPAGDMTEIGERGINLSGGQKQRVALARAVYKDANIYLLDDPLSAVDSHVGRHLFEWVIGPNGLLSQKTRVWVTHGLTYLSKVDSVAVMNDGHLSQVESFKELEQHQFVDESQAEAAETYTSPCQAAPLQSQTNGNAIIGTQQGRASINPKLQEDRMLERTQSRIRQRTTENLRKHRLTTVEKMEEGAVKSAVYHTYVNAASPKYIFVAIAVLLAWQVLDQATKVWLMNWSAAGEASKTDGGINANVSYYLGVYGAMNIGLGATSLLGNILLLLASVRAARCLHLHMFQRVVRSPISFFDTTPVGRILSRFSMDVDVIDTTFPKNLQFTILNCFELVGTLIVICYNTPWVFLAVIPACALSALFQRFYLATSRQLKRLESQTSSPINSQFSEVVTGAATIRAFRAQQQFITRFEETVDTNNMAAYACRAASGWLNICIGSVANVIVLLSAVFAVTSGIDTSSAGLCVSHALNLSQLLSYLVCSASEAETNIVAIERVEEYCHIGQEAAWHVPTPRPPSDWPSSGRITFHNYDTRYRPGLSLALKGVSCTISPGEKIGIVGRTGAGKSSLTLALFRLIEAAGGHIEIDGLKLADLGLHDVRGKITIIPQDPMLFSGSLQKNLDPFGKYSDDEIWWALDCAHLKSFVQSLPAGIDFVIKEGGENLSVGQKQLVCLARALLYKTKVLILDEATAAIDLRTDELIQKTIQTEFKDSTVLTIAHRLNSIINSDRVMVMERGAIREFAAPKVLLEDTSSLFYSMAKVTDIA